MKNRVIVIGASYNGLSALTKLVEALPPDLPAPLFVVMHIPPTSQSVLPQLLTKSGSLPAAHAQDGEHFEPGRIYVAPPDRHHRRRRSRRTMSGGNVHVEKDTATVGTTETGRSDQTLQMPPVVDAHRPLAHHRLHARSSNSKITSP